MILSKTIIMGGAGTRKGKMLGKIFGTALVFMMVASLVAGPTPLPLSNFDSHALAQEAPELEWSRIFGCPGRDTGYSVEQTSDGGFVIAGYRDSYGGSHEDVYLIKTDATGNEQWSKTFGGSSLDVGSSATQTSDGGFIVVGGTQSYGPGSCGVYLIKTDASGDEKWNKTFGGSSWDEGSSVKQTSDGGFIIVGYTHSYGAGYYDIYLIKTDAAGEEQWSRTLGGPGYDFGSQIEHTSDGGFIVIGTTRSYGAGCYDIYLIKTDAAGEEQWSRTFGGPSDDDGKSVWETSDGGFIIVGETQSYGAGLFDVWLIKTDSNGNKVWDKTFGGENFDDGYSGQQTSDGGYIVAGSTGSYGAGGESDIWLIKTDSNGNNVWNKTFGGADGDYGYSVQQTADGGYILVGRTCSYGAGSDDVWLIKLAPTKPWYVDDDLQDYPAADFTKIQDAVDAATSGDTIIVYPGTYTENIDVNKDHLTISSENGAHSTIVQAANSDDHVFNVTADWVNISGLTVQNATGSTRGLEFI